MAKKVNFEKILREATSPILDRFDGLQAQFNAMHAAFDEIQSSNVSDKRLIDSQDKMLRSVIDVVQRAYNSYWKTTDAGAKKAPEVTGISLQPMMTELFNTLIAECQTQAGRQLGFTAELNTAKQASNRANHNLALIKDQLEASQQEVAQLKKDVNDGITERARLRQLLAEEQRLTHELQNEVKRLSTVNKAADQRPGRQPVKTVLSKKQRPQVPRSKTSAAKR